MSDTMRLLIFALLIVPACGVRAPVVEEPAPVVIPRPLPPVAPVIEIPAVPRRHVGWHADYATAWKEAARHGVPLLVYLTTDACVNCLKMERGTFPNVDLTGVVAVKVHEKNARWLAKLLTDHVKPTRLVQRGRLLVREPREIQYPFFALAAPDTTILRTHEGYLDAPGFRDWLAPKAVALNNPGCRCLYNQDACTCGAACECLGPHWWRQGDDTEIVRACPPGQN